MTCLLYEVKHDPVFQNEITKNTEMTQQTLSSQRTQELSVLVEGEYAVMASNPDVRLKTFKFHKHKVTVLLKRSKEFLPETDTIADVATSFWHLTLHGHQMVTVIAMNDLLPPPLSNVNRPSYSEIQLFQNLTMKILGQGHACGQRSRSHLTLKIQRSGSWPRSNPLVTWEVWISICLFFVSWQSDHFWLKYSKFHIWPWNWKSRSWSMLSLMAIFEA